MLQPRSHSDASGMAKIPSTASASAICAARVRSLSFQATTSALAASAPEGNPTVATSGAVDVGAATVVVIVVSMTTVVAGEDESEELLQPVRAMKAISAAVTAADREILTRTLSTES